MAQNGHTPDTRVLQTPLSTLDKTSDFYSAATTAFLTQMRTLILVELSLAEAQVEFSQSRLALLDKELKKRDKPNPKLEPMPDPLPIWGPMR